MTPQLAEFNATGGVVRSYGYLPSPVFGGSPLFMKTPTTTAFFVLDHLGAPVMLVEGDGTVAWRLNRDAFGRSVVDPASRLTCPLRASSQYADEESGLNYNFHRYYDPVLGRYINRDPVGEAGGINLYSFCGNNPVNFVDSDGRVVQIMAILGVMARSGLQEGGIGAMAGLISGAFGGAIDSLGNCDFSWKNVGIGAASGFVGGFVGGFSSGAMLKLDGGIVGGAFGGYISTVIYQKWTGDDRCQKAKNADRKYAAIVGAITGKFNPGIGAGLSIGAGALPSALNYVERKLKELIQPSYQRQELY